MYVMCAPLRLDKTVAEVRVTGCVLSCELFGTGGILSCMLFGSYSVRVVSYLACYSVRRFVLSSVLSGTEVVLSSCYSVRGVCYLACYIGNGRRRACGRHHLHRGHALEVRLAGGDVLLIHFLRQIKHVGRKQRLPVLREVLLPIPRQRKGEQERRAGE